MKMGKLEECKDIDQTSDSVPNFTFRQCGDSEQVRFFLGTFPRSVCLTLWLFPWYLLSPYKVSRIVSQLFFDQ